MSANREILADIRDSWNSGTRTEQVLLALAGILSLVLPILIVVL